MWPRLVLTQVPPRPCGRGALPVSYGAETTKPHAARRLRRVSVTRSRLRS